MDWSSLKKVYEMKRPFLEQERPLFWNEAGLLGSNQRGGAQCAVRIALGDLGDRNRTVVACVAGLTELRHAGGDDLLHGFAGGLVVVARIELLRAFPQNLTDSAGDGEAVVSVHIDLANPVLDTELDLFDRHAPGFL